MDLLAAVGNSLLLGLQEFEPLPCLVQAGLGRGLLGDTFDLPAQPIGVRVGLVPQLLEAAGQRFRRDDRGAARTEVSPGPLRR